MASPAWLSPNSVSQVPPGDSYEVTVGMAMALVSRGWEYGRNLPAPVLSQGAAQRDGLGGRGCTFLCSS